ncbi:MAG: sulfurtransferase [Candidatus Latescibacteria bacterium]|nr:sulfurtransferase [Candidatus Latescibacterota bacterium]
MANYAHPEALVNTDWVAQHLNDSNLRLVEVDVDTTAYEQGHIAGAVGWNWQTQLCDQVRRDIVGKGDFERLLGQSGIGNHAKVILYGDNNNWFAAWAFWQFTIYGHQDVQLMNGGRKKWIEEQRELTKDAPKITPATYTAREPDYSIRAFRSDIFGIVEKRDQPLVDVRSPDEYTGKIIAPPGLPETAQRAGRIPSARSIPWGRAVNEDGTFKSYDDLKALYEGQGVTSDKDVIAYCRIGERSSHTWFVLKYLLGYLNVRNYDGSWTEYGNLVDAPIEKG